jgi:hypothetical protein
VFYTFFVYFDRLDGVAPADLHTTTVVTNCMAAVILYYSAPLFFYPFRLVVPITDVIALKPVLGCIRDAAFSIISHEQTQFIRVCDCYQFILLCLHIFRYKFQCDQHFIKWIDFFAYFAKS